MKPIARLGPSPLSRSERRKKTILFIGALGRRRNGSPRHDWEAELLAVGVDPTWSLEAFDAWVEEGEAEEEKR